MESYIYLCNFINFRNTNEFVMYRDVKSQLRNDFTTKGTIAHVGKRTKQNGYLVLSSSVLAELALFSLHHHEPSQPANHPE